MGENDATGVKKATGETAWNAWEATYLPCTCYGTREVRLLLVFLPSARCFSFFFLFLFIVIIIIQAYLLFPLILSFSNYVRSFLLSPLLSYRVAYIQETFERIDEDADGFITSGQAARGLAQLGLVIGVSRENVRQCMSYLLLPFCSQY